MKSLITRTISGLIFAAIMVTSILWGAISYIVLMAFIIAVMNFEYTRMSAPSGFRTEKVLAALSGILLFVMTSLVFWKGIDAGWILLATLPFVAMYICTLYNRIPGKYPEFQSITGSILYTAVPFTVLNFIMFGPGGEYDGRLLLAMFIILWGSDVGAYLFGMSLGQKFGAKLFPSISPKKSWIGFAGGLITAVAASCALNAAGMTRMDFIHSVILGLIINIFGVFGDLAESQLKRNFGAKDSGRIMPGHGGLLDRFDGALLSFPMAVIYIGLVVR